MKYSKRSSKPILVLGAYGRGNVGDDTFIISATQLFKNRRIYINSAFDSLLPKEARGKVETISTAGFKDIFKKIRIFLAVSEVVYWGGDLWTVLYRTTVPRQLLYKMLVANILLRLFGKKIYYIGCGVGDLEDLPVWLARASARMAKSVVVRDRRSAEILDLKNTSVLPDLAINFLPNKAVLHKLPSKALFTIVVSVMWAIPASEENFPKLIKHVAELLDSLSPAKFKIVLLPMNIAPDPKYQKLPDDLWTSNQLAALIKNHVVELYTDRNIQSVVKLLRSSNLVIGTRLHASILAVLNGTPTIGISYRPKVRAFFEDNQLGSYCIDLDKLDNLPSAFHGIYDDYEKTAKLFYKVSKRNLDQRAEYAKLINSL